MALTDVELENIKIAVELIYGVDAPKVIGEHCLCSGVDVIGQSSTVEANGVQACFFVETEISLEPDVLDAVTTIVEVGGMEIMKLGVL
jgi:hypothetical protein